MTCQLQDNNKAAEILASHGHTEAAVKRLVNPYQIAVVQGRQQELSATDQAVLKQIHTYCASMGTTWAQQQVRSRNLSSNMRTADVMP